LEAQRWLEDIENDWQEPKVKRWRQKANNKEEQAYVINGGQGSSRNVEPRSD
jgi:hypothetical protein